ncbi:MAG TPA: hypothetical protein VNK70_02940 [Candidatus Paceibacterota bacterium]|nr:hypothetical protein [Candidatus Paceibacterota bacterium]
MERIFTAFVFVSIVLVAVFGFAAMSHGAGHCIASAIQGAVCPTDNLFGFASFHLGFLKNFSSATFGSLAAALAIVALIALALFLTVLEPTILSIVAILKASAGTKVFSVVEKIRQWLSLLENSPSLARASG